LRDGVEIYLLKSGVGIVRGARDEFNALQSYMRVLSLFSHG